MNRNIALLILIAASFTSTSSSQLSPDGVPPEKDLNNIYARLSASDMVVTGTVIKSISIARKLSEEEKTKLYKPAPDGTFNMPLDITHGGTLYLVIPDRQLCQKSDFVDGNGTRLETPAEIRIFVPRAEPLWQNGQRREALENNRRYLLFLSQAEQQTVWAQQFELDSKVTYFRARRGAIPLPPTKETPGQKMPPQMLDKVTKLCQAVRPAQTNDKVANLRLLEGSGDPILAREARLAELSFQGAKHPSTPKNQEQ